MGYGYGYGGNMAGNFGAFFSTFGDFNLLFCFVYFFTPGLTVSNVHALDLQHVERP